MLKSFSSGKFDDVRISSLQRSFSFASQTLEG